ncbi:SAP DNA-binding domain-containing protein [Tieghemostelium lacteum]|uniref:SAP DNA-binding domain-containing protein n=1 Tax=Tieghemostelium lacteum TaxID=361077 RepID=A0A151ZG47_TIELA|nr:SAP DNA-binding domain-containing protein [Tieghemostelium lacteum]|eukprot:KYQ92952.1 SAP DNA-binding domain-containing protein [Tieghemostelium lacteum]
MTHTREELEKKLYKEIVAIAKSLEVKASGKKDEIIDRILSSGSEESSEKTTTTTTTTTNTTSTPSTKKPAPKRKLETKEESEEEESEEEVVEEKVKKAAAKPKPAASKKKAAAKKATTTRSTKKHKKEAEEEEDVEMDKEDEEEDGDEDMSIDPNNNNVKSKSPDVKQTVSAKKGPKSSIELKKWHTKGSIVYYLDEYISKPKIAGFDLDYTIVKTKSGNVHSINANDWLWWNTVVPERLVEKYKEGYHIVIFSNQGGIKSGSQRDNVKYNAITKKILAIADELKIPIGCFIATDDDINKKPSKSMWDFMLEECTDGSDIPIQISESFYVGDAAGRPEGWKPGAKADFSNSDSGFAKTVGMEFQTPEQFFLDEPPFEVNLSELIPAAPRTGAVVEGGSITCKEFEMVIFVGFPASGKSTFARKHYEPAGYVIVNGDTLKSKPAQIKLAKQSLAEKKSVVIDNTNGLSSTRAEWIALAKQYGASIRCFRFRTSYDLAMHLNYYRERTLNVKHISEMVYRIFNKNLVEPTLSEGFKEINFVNFILDIKPEQESQYFIANPKAKSKKTK